MRSLDDFLKGFLSADEHENSSSCKWVEWEHISQGKTHCEDCLVLDGCWFSKAEKPNAPLHPYCHCITKPLPYSRVLDQANTRSAFSKFDPYLFNTQGTYTHQKEKLFKRWGYTANDAAWLQEEMEQQALHKYVSGDYTLGKLNEKGQRINIRIDLDRKDGSGTVSFISGWMLQPNGALKLNTPYGGK